SAGAKERIGVARAFLRGSKLVLLDAPTCNVDSINEGIILKSLADRRKDICIILVSHRESTMSIADRVYRIQDGKISEVRN
ncbi:MAG: ABC transporter ATP-binding protein, partial [Clostridia bacterium]|nr:ABC transporter ATP-binding protein [Clostridia bacterium]